MTEKNQTKREILADFVAKFKCIIRCCYNSSQWGTVGQCTVLWEAWVQVLAGSLSCVLGQDMGKTLNSHSAPLHPGVYMSASELSDKPD